MNNIVDLSWYFGCAFGHDKAKGVVKIAQTAFVDPLVERFDVQYASQTPAPVEFDLGPKRSDDKESD